MLLFNPGVVGVEERVALIKFSDLLRDVLLGVIPRMGLKSELFLVISRCFAGNALVPVPIPPFLI